MKRIVLAAAALVLGNSCLNAQTDAGRLLLPPYEKVQLRNGTTLLLMEHHEVPIVSFSVIVKAGSVADPNGKEGVALLTADLLRKGTTLRTADQIAVDLDFIGGDFDVNAGLDFTSASAEFLSKDLGQGLDVVAEMLTKPAFPQAEFDKLLQQRINGIKSAKDQASNIIARYFNKYLYGSHPYGRPVGGDETSLAGIRRQDVATFYETHYSPANVIIAAVGDFRIPEMRRLLEARLDSWPARAATETQVTEPEPMRGKRVLLVDKPDSTQTYFYIGNLGISRTDPDRVAIAVINTLFGGRFTSRLNTALRVDSGLTYGASSQFDQRNQRGPFLVSTYTRNESTGKAIDMALEILKTLHERGVTDAELQSVKTYMKGQFPPTIETSDRLASTIARLEFYGLDHTDVDGYYAKVDAVDLDVARRIIRQHFPLENLILVLVGKASEIKETAARYSNTALEIKSVSQPGF